jgi:nucleotide-binding universal stress UspA family protein
VDEESVVSKIIVGVDASVHSEDAVAFARELHRAGLAEVLLASAYGYSPRLDGPEDLALRAQLEAAAEERLQALAETFGGAVETRAIPESSPARALHELGEDEGAVLLVVGSSHRSRRGQVLIGSTATRLIHGAPCAVAVVPSEYRVVGLEPRFDRVGCALDASAEAQIALGVAAAVAQARDAELSVIHAFDPAEYATPAVVYAPAYAYAREDLERRAREDLQRAVDALPHGIRAEAVLETGRAAAVLAAASGRLDLLFVGSRGYGPLRAVLAGSVTQHLLRDAECPVIVLPRGAEQPIGALFTRPESSRRVGTPSRGEKP